MLKISGLSVAYGGLHALEDVSLEVAEGEFVTIVGPNGAGKTTLMRAISGAVRYLIHTYKIPNGPMLVDGLVTVTRG